MKINAFADVSLRAMMVLAASTDGGLLTTQSIADAVATPYHHVSKAMTKLRELGLIVHDIDLKDDRFHRLEATGLKAIIDGLCEKVSDDRKRLQQAGIVFDSLFALLDKTSERQRKSTSTKKKRTRKK